VFLVGDGGLTGGIYADVVTGHEVLRAVDGDAAVVVAGNDIVADHSVAGLVEKDALLAVADAHAAVEVGADVVVLDAGIVRPEQVHGGEAVAGDGVAIAEGAAADGDVVDAVDEHAALAVADLGGAVEAHADPVRLDHRRAALDVDAREQVAG